MSTSPEKTWPELGEELGRKVIDVLHDRLWELNQGKITDKEMLLIANSLYDSISGLVPWDVANIVYSVREELTISENADVLDL